MGCLRRSMGAALPLTPSSTQILYNARFPERIVWLFVEWGVNSDEEVIRQVSCLRASPLSRAPAWPFSSLAIDACFIPRNNSEGRFTVITDNLGLNMYVHLFFLPPEC
jgi:hypothetical protein